MTEQRAHYQLSEPGSAERRLSTIKPHLEAATVQLATGSQAFQEHLQTFLASAEDDPTKLHPLISRAQALQREVERVVSLLGQVDASRIWKGGSGKWQIKRI